jgi:septal ring-binding cell division protein DamX
VLLVLMAPQCGALADTSIRRDDWYSSRPGGHATIQLSGHISEQAAVDYIRRNNITGKVGYFSTRFRDKPWYAVTYGEYDSLDKARKGLALLPENLRIHSPWPRSFSAIKLVLEPRSMDATTTPPSPEITQDKKPKPAVTENEAGEQAPIKDKQPVQTAGVEGNDWFLARSPGHMTIQIYGSWEKTNAIQFVKTHGIEDRSHLLNTSRAGRPWYSVTFGEFNSLSEAKKADAELSGQIGITNTWVRTFGSIQEAINKQQKIAVDSKPGRAADVATVKNPSHTGISTADRDQLRKAQSLFVRGKYTDALEIWTPLAEKGIAEAQYSLGFLYHSGWGPERDLEQAIRWYTLASNQQESRAQFNLGVLLIEGEPGEIPIDYKNGIKWIKQSAHNGNTRARELLADAYEKGLYNLPQSSKDAQYWKTQ